MNGVDQTLEFLNNKLGVGSDELKVYFLIAILTMRNQYRCNSRRRKRSSPSSSATRKQRGLLNAGIITTDANTDAYKIFAAVLNALYELDLCEEKYP